MKQQLNILLKLGYKLVALFNLKKKIFYLHLSLLDTYEQRRRFLFCNMLSLKSSKENRS